MYFTMWKVVTKRLMIPRRGRVFFTTQGLDTTAKVQLINFPMLVKISVPTFAIGPPKVRTQNN